MAVAGVPSEAAVVPSVETAVAVPQVEDPEEASESLGTITMNREHRISMIMGAGIGGFLMGILFANATSSRRQDTSAPQGSTIGSDTYPYE